MEALDQLFHYLLNNVRCNLSTSEVDEFFKVTPVAVLHEDIVPRVCLDSFLHPYYILALDYILVYDFAHHKLLLRLPKSFPLNHLACEVAERFPRLKLNDGLRLILGLLASIFLAIAVLRFRVVVGDELAEVDFSELAPAQRPLYVNEEVAYLLHLNSVGGLGLVVGIS